MNPNKSTASRIHNTRSKVLSQSDIRSETEMDISSSLIEDKSKVSPHDFVEFLPWACVQMEVEVNVVVKRNVQLRAKTKSKNIMTSDMSLRSFGSHSVLPKSTENPDDHKKTVIISALYTDDHLTNITIEKAPKLPRKLFRVIGLGIPFYPFLHGISVHSGVDGFTIYELKKLLPLSNITEISLDNTFIKEGNHDLLLDCKQLKILSLARCRLGDKVLHNIATKLDASKDASNPLASLNVSSNLLTDKSAIVIANVLRRNRDLRHLNLAGNMITDVGMSAIMAVLNRFPLTSEEALALRRNKMTYVKKLISHTDRVFEQLRLQNESEKKGKEGKDKDKHAKFVLDMSRIVLPQRTGKKQVPNDRRSITDIRRDLYEEASEIAKRFLGDFVDPFGKDCINVDGVFFYNGNNYLTYLNVSFNHLEYDSVKNILQVLQHQSRMKRDPIGLLKVSFDGNPMPKVCKEYLEIDNLLSARLDTVENREFTFRHRKAMPPGTAFSRHTNK